MALNSIFSFIDKHNTLLAMQRLIKRKSCMLGLVVFEIWVAPMQRGKQLESYYTLQIRYNTQSFGQLPKWRVMWLGSINQVKDFKPLKVTTLPPYPPSTRTPFIWVRCIFFNKERESATSIFLQPSRSKICCKEHKTQWLLNRWAYQLPWQVSAGFLLLKIARGTFKAFQAIIKEGKEEPPVTTTTT